MATNLYHATAAAVRACYALAYATTKPVCAPTHPQAVRCGKCSTLAVRNGTVPVGAYPTARGN